MRRLILIALAVFLLTSCETTLPEGVGLRFSIGYKGVSAGFDFVPSPPPAPAVQAPDPSPSK